MRFSQFRRHSQTAASPEAHAAPVPPIFIVDPNIPLAVSIVAICEAPFLAGIAVMPDGRRCIALVDVARIRLVPISKFANPLMPTKSYPSRPAKEPSHMRRDIPGRVSDRGILWRNVLGRAQTQDMRRGVRADGRQLRCCRAQAHL